MNKNEIQGKATAVKGQAKQVVGNAVGNTKMAREGKADEVAGKTQAAIGTATRKVGNAVENLGKAIKK